MKYPSVQVLKKFGNKTNVISLPFVVYTSINWSMPFEPIRSIPRISGLAEIHDMVDDEAWFLPTNHFIDDESFS